MHRCSAALYAAFFFDVANTERCRARTDSKRRTMRVTWCVLDIVCVCWSSERCSSTVFHHLVCSASTSRAWSISSVLPCNIDWCRVCMIDPRISACRARKSSKSSRLSRSRSREELALAHSKSHSLRTYHLFEAPIQYAAPCADNRHWPHPTVSLVECRAVCICVYRCRLRTRKVVSLALLLCLVLVVATDNDVDLAGRPYE